MPIPAHILTGHLGAGKTSAIGHLLRHRPTNERWAVIVNEFGELGIDGARLRRDEDGLLLEEITGACICCGLGSPLIFVLERLLEKQRFDRLVIEPTGLAEPTAVTDTFSAPTLRDRLQRMALVTLVDMRAAARQRWQHHATAQRQVHAADVLVGTFADEASDAEKAAFSAFSQDLQPAKLAALHAAMGALPMSILDLAPLRAPVAEHHAHAEHDHEDVASFSARYPAETVLDRGRLNALLEQWAPRLYRAKGFVRTAFGHKRFDVDGGGSVRWRSIPAAAESRLELIGPGDVLDAARLEGAIGGCLVESP